MKFGLLPVDEANCAVLAHAIKTERTRLKKGTVLDPEMLDALRAAGVESVIAARLEDGDTGEDEAARLLGAELECDMVVAAAAFTGRANLHASADGLFTARRETIDAFNRIDPAITLATLDSDTPVENGRLVATVKIIPFAVSQPSLAAALELLGSNTAIHVHPWKPKKALLIQTEVSGLKPSILDKTARILDERLHPLDGTVCGEERLPHRRGALAEMLKTPRDDADIIIIFGASAIADPDDVIPGALRDAGGEVTYLGMPVDPGNLLMVGKLGAIPIIGAPGCARSPAENGFDWVLRRIIAEVPVDAGYISGLGVGGLLMEITARPQPREGNQRAQ